MGLRPSDKISAVAEGPPTAHPTATSARFVKPKNSAGQLNYNIVGLPIENPGLLADRFLRLAIAEAWLLPSSSPACVGTPSGGSSDVGVAGTGSGDQGPPPSSGASGPQP